MEKRLSRDFKSKVLLLLDDDEDRVLLFQALQDYQQVRSVRTLVKQLKNITTNPDRLVLYDEIRPFILPKHQSEYDKIIPKPPSERPLIIRLVHGPGAEGLGCKFVGGVEFGVGIFICEVLPKSQAEKKGLKAGDEVIRVNGYSIEQATHNEVLAAMRLHKTLMLKVKRVGMYPVKSSALDEITWKLVPTKGAKPPVSTKVKSTFIEKDRKVFANLEAGMKLGCGIGTSTDDEPGIFVHKISEGSMAEHLGFNIGDQIMDVNGESFLDITHSEAVVILKSSRHLTITLRSKEFVDNSSEEDPPYQGNSNMYMAGGSMGMGGSMGIKGTMGMGGSMGARSAYDHTGGNQDSMTKRLQEEKIEAEEEESMALVMTNPNWSYKPPPLKEKEEEKEDVEEEEELVVIKKSVNRFAAIVKEENEKEQEKREREGTYVPQSPGEKDMWWSSSPYNLFTKRQIDDRELRKIEIPKVGSLDIELEGGFGTPLGGKLVVSEVFADGAAAKSGELGRGDQIMMVEGRSFIDINRQMASQFLDKCMASSQGHGKLRMIIALAPKKAYEDEITFF